MAARTSFYRPTGHTRRNNARQIHDHDVFEGLPIRRWSKEWIWIASPPEIPVTTPSTSLSLAVPDLPLPKDTHLLTPMSQTLLQAARNGTLMKPIEETQKEKEDEAQNKDSHRLFLTSKWTLAPRDKEPPEIEYLSTVVRGSKRKINGKFVDIEEEEHLVHHDLVGGMQGLSNAAMKRRPPPPRRKPGKGRKAGFKKMVTFAEDGRALPVGETGVAAPPPPVPLSPPQEYMNEPMPTAPLYVEPTKLENVVTEQILSTSVEQTSPPLLPPIVQVLNNQPVEATTAPRLDSDIEMGDASAAILPSTTAEQNASTLLNTNKHESPLMEPPIDPADDIPLPATSISPPHTSMPSLPPLVALNVAPAAAPVVTPAARSVSPLLEKSPSLPPKPSFNEDRPQGLPERPSFLDVNRPPGLPLKPAFLEGPKPPSLPPPPPALGSIPATTLPVKAIDEGEISEGEVEEPAS